MSHHWNMKCVPCDLVVFLRINHGSEDIEHVIRHRVAFEFLGLRIPQHPVQCEFYSKDVSGLTAHFFVEHKDHELVAWSEYGYRSQQDQ